MALKLLDVLAKSFPTAKRTTLRRLLSDRRVAVNGKIVISASTLVEDGDEIGLADVKKLRPKKLKPPVPIIHDDEDILIIDKPAGLLTSTTPREKRPTAIALLTEFYGQVEPAARLGVIHRLDRDASGLLVFSKNNSAYHELKGQLLKHSMGRVYAAVVHGTPANAKGTLRSRLVEKADGTVHSTKLRNKGEAALTDYEIIESAAKMSLLRVTLQTGRKHQIRVQLSEAGHAVVNDSVYSTIKPNGRLMLAAIELELTHPKTGERLLFQAEMPREFEKCVGGPVSAA